MDQEGDILLVTIEGIDGTGKSTLVASLSENLADLNPVFTKEPGSTWVGKAVRKAIAEEADPVAEALLFAADHAAHLAGVVRPALGEGRIVISDRYTDSRYAYQTAMLEGRIAEPLAWLRSVHDGWTIPPDRTYLLVLPVDEAVTRASGKARLEHFEERSFLEKVQKNYLGLAAEDPVRFLLIDAGKEKEEILGLVAGDIRRLAGSRRSRRRR